MNIQIAPGTPQGHATVEGELQAGLQALNQQQFDPAWACGLRALALQPDDIGALNLLGLVALNQGQHALALPFFERASRLAPDTAGLWHNLGLALQGLGRADQALSAYQRALGLAPDHPEVMLLCGELLRASNRFEEALALFTRLLQRAPQLPALPQNLALTHYGLKNWAEADRWFALADRAPVLRELFDWEYALYLLHRKRFAEGWARYEARGACSRFNHVHLHPHPQPRWQGQSLRGRRLLVQREQGLGDEIMFGQLLAGAVAEAESVLFVASPALLRLWRWSLPPQVTVVEDWTVTPGAPPPAAVREGRFDFHIHLGSLPHVCRFDPATAGPPRPGLRVDPALVQAWARRLAALPGEAGGLRIGLMWGANPARFDGKLAQRAADKSIPLPLLRPLTEIAGLRCISLANAVNGWEVGASGLPIVDFSALLTDLAETAALMANLDLVVTIDTSVAHLAGALGLRTWLLLPWRADWRWAEDDTTSDWYPQVRLWRQPRPGDWASVVDAVVQALRAECTASPRVGREDLGPPQAPAAAGAAA